MNKIIKEVFGLDELYDRKFGIAFFVDLIYVGLAIFFIASILSINPTNGEYPIGLITFYILICIGILYFLREIAQSIYITLIIKSRKYTLDKHSKSLSHIYISSVNDQLNLVDMTKLIKSDSNYKIFDLRFDFFRKTKYGEYKSKELFFTAIEYKLQRKLPHLVFDSKKARGRQFKSVFLKSQSLNLEGNFNKYFDIYSPLFYHIDVLSFITPEVMQAMIDLKEYDIEIKEDSLICFSPILENKEIEKFNKKVENLYYHLNNNLDTYRDQRLDYASGKKNVSDFGRSLLITSKKYVYGSILFGSICTVILVFTVTRQDLEILFNVYSLYVFCLFFFNFYFAWSRYSKNQKLINQYKSENELQNEISNWKKDKN